MASLGEPWFAVIILVQIELLLKAVDHLRRAGASGISVDVPEFIFGAESRSFARALHELAHPTDAKAVSR